MIDMIDMIGIDLCLSCVCRLEVINTIRAVAVIIRIEGDAPSTSSTIRTILLTNRVI